LAEKEATGDKLKEEHSKTVELYHDLVDTHEAMEVRYHDAQDKLVRAAEADELTLRAQVEELAQSKEQHIRALDQARVALQAASALARISCLATQAIRMVPR
jgi:ferritin-like metal-binding protein YciE